MEERLDPQEDERLRRIEMGLGVEAASLLDNNGAFKRAFDALRDQIWDDFRSCHPSDMDGLRSIRLRMGLLEDLQSELRLIHETGLMAKEQLEESERRRRADAETKEEDKI